MRHVELHEAAAPLRLLINVKEGCLSTEQESEEQNSTRQSTPDALSSPLASSVLMPLPFSHLVSPSPPSLTTSPLAPTDDSPLTWREPDSDHYTPTSPESWGGSWFDSLSLSRPTSRQTTPRPHSTSVVDARRGSRSFFGDELMSADEGTSSGVLGAAGLSALEDRPLARSQSIDSISELSSQLQLESVSPLLPCIETGAACAIPRVSVSTMAKLIRGEFKHILDHYLIVDCRYDYEYEAGHLIGASHISSKQEIEQFYLAKRADKEKEKENEEGERKEKKTAVIFHCEFSKNRGPTAGRFFRQLDRTSNAYPRLTFPDVYVMEGGYKLFYETFPQLCEPRGYVSMWDSKFQKECKLRKRASKRSWAKSPRSSVSTSPSTRLLRAAAKSPRGSSPSTHLTVPTLRRSSTLPKKVGLGFPSPKSTTLGPLWGREQEQ